MSSPEDIREEIARTRAELSENVNALGDSASPSNIARGQVDKVKESAESLKERIFGAPEDPRDDGVMGDARSAVATAGDSAAGMVSDAREAISDAPQQLKSRARGNPIAAGLIAMGVGALIGGLIPASRKETEMAHQIKDAAEPLVEQAKQVVNEAKDNLQPVVQDAVGSVKDVAEEAGESVKQDAQNAAGQIKDKAADSADSVKSDAQNAAEKTKRDAQGAAREQTPGSFDSGS